jgi:ribosomal protein S18 acetylase RimI-like enzyme
VDGLRIRPYRTEDRDDVVRLWNACGLVVPWNDPVRDIERKLKNDPERFLVGVLDGKVVATCMAGYEGHRGWINYLAVSPALRRRGIASRLMREAESLLKKAGCPKICLQVRSSNVQVVRFYENLGYSKDDVISMGKRLVRDEPPSAAPDPTSARERKPAEQPLKP